MPTPPDERRRLIAEAEHHAQEAEILLATIQQAFAEAQKILPTNAVKAHYKNGVCKPTSYEIVTQRLTELKALPTRLRSQFKSEDTAAAARLSAHYSQEPQSENALEAAIIYLLRYGKQLGLDFHLSNALEVANTTAEAEFIQLQKLSNKPIRFTSATPCSDQCDGWNPRYQTCTCGRNRLRWQRAQGHSWEQPKMVPIATKAVCT